MSRIISGPRFVLEALRGHSGVETVYVRGSSSGKVGKDGKDGKRGKGRDDAGTAAVREEAERRGVRVETRSRDELDRLAGGVKHQGIVAVAGEYQYADVDSLLRGATSPPLLVALDNVTDPHNMGAIVRSAVAFGADGILVPKHNAVGVTPVVVRASAGTTERARIAKVTNLQRTLMSLSERGLQVVGLDGDGECDVDALPPAPDGRVLVVGSEGRGMRRMVRERCDVVARIDAPGEAESLNASVAAGIALFAAHRQRHAE